jgi:transcriptional regulator with XRE-family HTH domain
VTILGDGAAVSDSQAHEPPVPNRLREYRLRLGLEQADVAAGLAALSDEEIALDANAVSRHERGKHRPTKRYRRLYCQLLQASEAELWPRQRHLDEASDPLLAAPWTHRGTVDAAVAVTESGEPVERRAFLFLTGAALTAPAHQWLVQEPGRLVAALRGDRVTPELANRLPPMIAELRRMDDLHSPGMVLSLAEREFAWVAGLLDRSSYDEVIGRRLHVALAELGQIAGFAAYDMGNQIHAQRYYLTALRAAHTADDRAIAGNILKFMAEQAAYVGRPQDAL